MCVRVGIVSPSCSMPNRWNASLVPDEYISDVVYGASIKSIASMLHAGHHVALDRVSSILSYITHGMMEPSKGTIYKFIKEFARKNLPEFVAVLGKSLDSSVKYTDGTYITVNGNRSYKGHLKMSEGFRSQEGTSLFCRFQTVYQTIRRMGADILENMNKIFSRYTEKTDGFSACLLCFSKL